jgi:ribose/xylose/arabinose/galactoside ABC-type transport system permease subunit
MKNLATLWLVVLIVGCIALGVRSGMLDLSCGAAMNCCATLAARYPDHFQKLSSSQTELKASPGVE